MMDDTLKQTWEIIDNKYIFFYEYRSEREC